MRRAIGVLHGGVRHAMAVAGSVSLANDLAHAVREWVVRIAGVVSRVARVDHRLIDTSGCWLRRRGIGGEATGGDREERDGSDQHYPEIQRRSACARNIGRADRDGKGRAPRSRGFVSRAHGRTRRRWQLHARGRRGRWPAVGCPTSAQGRTAPSARTRRGRRRSRSAKAVLERSDEDIINALVEHQRRHERG